MKKILVIGGGKWQIPIIKKAKQLGHMVICTNLYENSPAFKYADYSYVVDVLNKEKNLEIAQKHNIDIAITDQSDIAVNTVAYINEKMDLNGVGINNAKLFTNKYKMREELKINNLHHPKYRLCKSIKEVQQFFKTINSKIILKPLNNQSSRGVSLITDEKEIKNAFLNAVKHSRNSTYILAEEFIDGIELTVEGFKYPNAKHYTFAVSKKTYFENKIGIANSLLYQPKFEEFDIEKLKLINNEIFKNIPYAITHVEYKYFNNKFYLIEAAIRGGGTKISSHIIPCVSGYDVNELLIKSALQEKIIHKNINYKQKYALLKFLDFGEGIVKNINISQDIHNLNIIDFELEFEIGDILKKPTDDRSRVGYVIICDSSFKNIESTFQKFYEKIKIKLENE